MCRVLLRAAFVGCCRTLSAIPAPSGESGGASRYPHPPFWRKSAETYCIASSLQQLGHGLGFEVLRVDARRLGVDSAHALVGALEQLGDGAVAHQLLCAALVDGAHLRWQPVAPVDHARVLARRQVDDGRERWTSRLIRSTQAADSSDDSARSVRQYACSPLSVSPTLAPRPEPLLLALACVALSDWEDDREVRRVLVGVNGGGEVEPVDRVRLDSRCHVDGKVALPLRRGLAVVATERAPQPICEAEQCSARHRRRQLVGHRDGARARRRRAARLERAHAREGAAVILERRHVRRRRRQHRRRQRALRRRPARSVGGPRLGRRERRRAVARLDAHAPVHWAPPRRGAQRRVEPQLRPCAVGAAQLDKVRDAGQNLWRQARVRRVDGHAHRQRVDRERQQLAAVPPLAVVAALAHEERDERVALGRGGGRPMHLRDGGAYAHAAAALLVGLLPAAEEGLGHVEVRGGVGAQVAVLRRELLRHRLLHRGRRLRRRDAPAECEPKRPAQPEGLARAHGLAGRRPARLARRGRHLERVRRRYARTDDNATWGRQLGTERPCLSQLLVLERVHH
eukprot:6196712-Pleurochrysis_carterae.AAC.4